MPARPERDPSAAIDRLLDRAAQAINHGDRAMAHELAGQVLAVDAGNPEAEDLLAAPVGIGEIRRLTILFCDLVDSTVLSTQIEPETYRMVVGRYREQVLQTVERYEGHIGSAKGDGMLAVFGHPTPHENDVRRAVQAGLDITRAVERLSDQVRRRFGIDIAVRVGVHRGLVYLDTTEDDVYGFAANLAARLEGLADPGTVVVSDVVRRLVADEFEFDARPPRPVKGVPAPVEHHVVVNERAQPAKHLLARRTPLVGRQRELDRLLERWEQAVGGTLATCGILLRGEAGMGKTRLAAAVLDRVEATGGVTIDLIGSPFHTDAGLHPVRELLERRCGIARTADASERLQRLQHEVAVSGLDTTTAIPLLAPVLGIAPEAGYEPAPSESRKLQEQIADAVEHYLLSCLGQGPALLLVEDLQWIDDSTRELITRFVRRDRGDILVVITSRDGVAPPGGSRVETLDLDPLTDDETSALIEVLDPDLPTAIRDEVVVRSDGVPLYIEQLVMAGGRDATGAHGGDATREPTTVPDALYEPLFARLRSSAQAVVVASAAATIGRSVERRVLSGVVDLDDGTLDAVLAELEDTLVLERHDAELWRFRHEMLRQVAYELQPPTARRSLHGRVADALVGGADEGMVDWRSVAGHYDRAERHVEAASAHERAAADARRRGALAEARAALTRAIDQIERAAPDPERIRHEIALRLGRGSLAVAAEGNSSPEAASDFERCLELCETDVQGDEMLGTLIALWGYYASRADLARALQVNETTRLMVEDGRQFFRPESDAGFGMVAWFRGEYDLARERLERGAALLTTLQRGHEVEALWYLPTDPVASIHTHLALARFVQGDVAGANAQLMATAVRTATLAFPQGPFSTAYARTYDVWMRVEEGDLDRAAGLADELAALADRHGFDSWALVAATQRTTVAALAALASGEPDAAAVTAQAAVMRNFVDTWHALEVRAFLTFYLAAVARLHMAAGQLDEARQQIDDALAVSTETGMGFYDAELLRLRAHVESDPSLTRSALGAASELARKQGALIFELRIALDDFDLRGEAAREALTDVVRRFPADSDWPELRRAKTTVR